MTYLPDAASGLCGITVTSPWQRLASTQAMDTLSPVLALLFSLQKRFCKVGYVLLHWLSSVTPR